MDSRCGTRDTLLASTFVILATPTCRRVIDRFAAVIESRHSKDVNPVILALRREEYRRGRSRGGGEGRGEEEREEESLYKGTEDRGGEGVEHSARNIGDFSVIFFFFLQDSSPRARGESRDQEDRIAEALSRSWWIGDRRIERRIT